MSTTTSRTVPRSAGRAPLAREIALVQKRVQGSFPVSAGLAAKLEVHR